MNRLIEDLLDLSQMEVGRFKLKIQSSCGPEVLGEVMEMMQTQAQNKSIKIKLSNRPENFKLNCDRDKLLRVFSNIVGNAIKYTPEGGEIELGAEEQQDSILFYINDNGPGIASQHLEMIFDRFWQERKNTGKGAGLGLTIAKGIVEAHGGENLGRE